MQQPAQLSEPLLEMIIWHDTTRAQSFHAYSSAEHSSRMPCLTRLSLFFPGDEGKDGQKIRTTGKF
jgi:hypothetical protein